MELVVIIIMIMVGFSLLLKLTYLPLWGQLLICALLALFVGLSWTFAVNQSKTQIAAWIQSPELMLDMAVLLTIDVFLQITFCVTSAERIVGEKLSKSEKIIRVIALWIPGILIFPVLLAVLVAVIFSFPGVDFETIAWSLAAALFVIGMGIPYLIKWVLPEKDLRLELIFMVNAMICLLGVIATVNGRTAVAGVNSVDCYTLGGVLALFIVGATAGYILFKRKQNKLIKSK